MPGVYGIIGYPSKDKFTRMRDILNHYAYKDDSYCSDQFLVGRLSLGTFFPSSQPVWDESREYGILADGHLIVGEDISDSRTGDRRTLQALLEWYKKEGNEFLAHIRTGMFNIVIIDLNNSQIKIINDRLGLLPLYYTYTEGKIFCFGPEEKALVGTGVIEKKIDWAGLGQFLSFHHLIGSRTFYEGVKLLEPATILEFDLISRKLTTKRYYDINYSTDTNLSLNECADRAYELFLESCKRLHLPVDQYGLMLSGGLDSRLILSALDDVTNTRAYTFGPEGGCQDVAIATEVARIKGIEHSVYWYDQENIVDIFREALWTLENLRHGLLAGFFKRMHEEGIDIVLDGLLGDVTLGGRFFSHLHSRSLFLRGCNVLKDKPPVRELASSVEAHIREVESSFLEGILNPSIYRKIRKCEDEIQNDIVEEVDKYYSFDCQEKVYDGVKLDSRERRAINPQGLRARFHMEVLYPFCDYDFMEFVFKIPLEFRIRDRLYYRLYRRSGTDLSKIKREYHDIAPYRPYYAHVMHARKSRLTNKIHRFLHGEYREGPHYLDSWLREGGNFARLIEDTLFARENLVNSEKIATLLGQRKSLECDMASWIWQIVSFVLWWEMFIEGNGPKDGMFL